jgi:chemotaxis protein methyltransferase CheR
MIPSIATVDAERFRHLIAVKLGLNFDDTKLGFLADILRRRLDTIGQPADTYLARLEKELSSEESGALASVLTVPETYFFRNGEQYRAFTEIALPDRLVAQSATRRIRILSAGCASGEETYSLAMLTRELVDPTWDLSILGIDANPLVLKKATDARYSSWALRETPAAVQQRWFRPEGREFVLDDMLRAAVKFEARNLAQPDPFFWRPESYDIIFFRNVLMYFTHEQGHAVIARMAQALKPGGYLFLGHAETLRGLSGDFHLQHTHETFYYRRKDEREPAARSAAPRLSSRSLVPAVVAAVEGAETWIEAIGRATERIEALTGAAHTPAVHRPASERLRTVPAWDLELALELLREERFAEALDMMQRLPPESEGDADVLLLNAALLTHGGRFTDAEDTCWRLLAVDELSAGAHYLLALCREGMRDRAGAVHHDQVASYLDPTFAMPHLHLGLLARRAEDRTAALRELGQALLLLQKEDSSRLLLFGGGFGREMLVALCRTELVGCGGKP